MSFEVILRNHVAVIQSTEYNYLLCIQKRRTHVIGIRNKSINQL